MALEDSLMSAYVGRVYSAFKAGVIDGKGYSLAMQIVPAITWSEIPGIYRRTEDALADVGISASTWKRNSGQLFDAEILTHDATAYHNVVVAPDKPGVASPGYPKVVDRIIEDREFEFIREADGAGLIRYVGDLEAMPF